MIDSEGNMGFYSYATQLSGSPAGVKLNFDPIYTTQVARLRRIAYAFPNAGGSVGIRLEDGAGNALTSDITLSGSIAYQTYYHSLSPGIDVKPGDVIRVNVITPGSNFLIGLFVD